MPAHQCLSGGNLVSPSDWLPTEAVDFDWVVAGLFIGCNNLRCSQCGEKVRDWIDGNIRKYACRCTDDRIGYAGRSVREPVNPMTEEMLPWECGGHPVLSLPAMLDGIAIDATTNWKALARDLFTHSVNPPVHPQAARLRGFFVQRLHNVLSESEGAMISNAVSQLLTDPEPGVRAAALAFFVTNMFSAGAERVAETLRDQPQLFLDVADPDEAGGTLWDWMTLAVEARLGTDRSGNPVDPLAREMLKRHAIARPGVGSSLHRLERIDPAWFKDHAEEILNAAPERWKTVLDITRLEDLARKIVERGYATDAEIVEYANQHFPPHEALRISSAFARAIP